MVKIEIGPRRARILELVAEGQTNNQIAKLIGISPARVSQHCNVLRKLGLLKSRYDEKGQCVRVRTRLAYQVTNNGLLD